MKPSARQLRELDVGASAACCSVSRPRCSSKSVAERRLGGGVLGEHAPARDLGDVRRLEVDLQREAVHEAGELDLLVVEAADELAELLLRGDDEPVLAAALTRRGSARWPGGRASSGRRGRRTGRPRRRRTSGTCPGWRRCHQLGARVRRACPGVMSARSLTPFTQESARRVGRRARCTCITRLASAQREGDLVPCRRPTPCRTCSLVELPRTSSSRPSSSRRDLQLGEVEVLGVAEALEEEPVHDLGQRLVAAPDAAVGGDVEDDGVGRDLLG